MIPESSGVCQVAHLGTKACRPIMRKMDGLGRTRVSKYLPLGPNGDQSPILSVRASRGGREGG